MMENIPNGVKELIYRFKKVSNDKDDKSKKNAYQDTSS